MGLSQSIRMVKLDGLRLMSPCLTCIQIQNPVAHFFSKKKNINPYTPTLIFFIEWITYTPNRIPRLNETMENFLHLDVYDSELI